MSALPAKLIVIALSLGAIAITLLSLRQQRLLAVHQLVVTQRQIFGLDENLWRFRVAVAERTIPLRVQEQAIAHFGPMSPMGVEPVNIPGFVPPGGNPAQPIFARSSARDTSAARPGPARNAPTRPEPQPTRGTTGQR